MITFFKPNKSNKGCLASFKLVHKQNRDPEPHKEGCVWLSLVKQVGWNEQNRTGSFKNGETINIKLNIIELGGLIDTIESGRSFEAFHSAKDKVSIKFAPFTPNGAERPVGFSFSVLRDKEGEKSNFNISFRFGEGKTLREFLRLAIQEVLMSNYADEKRRFKEFSKQNQGVVSAPDDVQLPEGVEGEDDEIPFL